MKKPCCSVYFWFPLCETISDIKLQYNPHLVQLVADFGTLLGTYDKGFAVIIEPWDGRLPNVPDPVIQLACLDASLAMKPVFDKFQVWHLWPHCFLLIGDGLSVPALPRTGFTRSSAYCPENCSECRHR